MVVVVLCRVNVIVCRFGKCVSVCSVVVLVGFMFIGVVCLFRLFKFMFRYVVKEYLLFISRLYLVVIV